MTRPVFQDLVALGWEMVSAPADPVQLLTKPREEWDSLDLRTLTRLEVGRDGALKLETIDRGRLLERLLEVMSK